MNNGVYEWWEDFYGVAFVIAAIAASLILGLEKPGLLLVCFCLGGAVACGFIRVSTLSAKMRFNMKSSASNVPPIKTPSAEKPRAETDRVDFVDR